MEKTDVEKLRFWWVYNGNDMETWRMRDLMIKTLITEGEIEYSPRVKVLVHRSVGSLKNNIMLTLRCARRMLWGNLGDLRQMVLSIMTIAHVPRLELQTNGIKIEESADYLNMTRVLLKTTDELSEEIKNEARYTWHMKALLMREVMKIAEEHIREQSELHKDRPVAEIENYFNTQMVKAFHTELACALNRLDLVNDENRFTEDCKYLVPPRVWSLIHRNKAIRDHFRHTEMSYCKMEELDEMDICKLFNDVEYLEWFIPKSLLNESEFRLKLCSEVCKHIESGKLPSESFFFNPITPGSVYDKLLGTPKFLHIYRGFSDHLKAKLLESALIANKVEALREIVNGLFDPSKSKIESEYTEVIYSRLIGCSAEVIKVFFERPINHFFCTFRLVKNIVLDLFELGSEGIDRLRDMVRHSLVFYVKDQLHFVNVDLEERYKCIDRHSMMYHFFVLRQRKDLDDYFKPETIENIVIHLKNSGIIQGVYLRWVHSYQVNRSDTSRFQRFFDVSSLLPLEMQMKVCNLSLSDQRDFITSRAIELASVYDQPGAHYCWWPDYHKAFLSHQVPKKIK